MSANIIYVVLKIVLFFSIWYFYVYFNGNVLLLWQSHLTDLFDLKDRDSKTWSQVRAERLASETSKFSSEHYLYVKHFFFHLAPCGATGFVAVLVFLESAWLFKRFSQDWISWQQHGFFYILRNIIEQAQCFYTMQFLSQSFLIWLFWIYFFQELSVFIMAVFAWSSSLH